MNERSITVTMITYVDEHDYVHSVAIKGYRVDTITVMKDSELRCYDE